uniref:Pesticidal crystal protein Cry22Aa Ig-like domain-containing protein n=1 Tax=viral metagenome TaxID=1070528 RepID=A0A6C0KYG5_9ZZZZ
MPKESINTIIFIMTSIFLFMLLFAFFTAKRDSNMEEFDQDCVTDDEIASSDIGWSDSDTGEWSDNGYRFWEAGAAECSKFNNRPGKCVPTDGEIRVVKKNGVYKTCKFDDEDEQPDPQEEEEVCRTGNATTFTNTNLVLTNGNSNQSNENIDYIHNQSLCIYKGCTDSNASNTVASINPNQGIIQNDPNLCITKNTVSYCNQNSATQFTNLELSNGDNLLDDNSTIYEHDQTKCEYKGCLDENAINNATQIPDDSGIIVNTNYQCNIPNRTPPTLKFSNGQSQDIINLYLGEAYYEESPIAIDKNGDDISTLIVKDGNLNTNEEGTYSFNYSVNDADGVASVPSIITRIIHIKRREFGTTMISLAGENPIVLNVGDQYIEPVGTTVSSDGITLSDDNIYIGKGGEDWDEDTSKPGYFSRTYTVKAMVNGQQKELAKAKRIIIVKDSSDRTPPSIILNGDNPLRIQKGNTYDELNATATDNNMDDLSKEIDINHNVDTNKIGNYIVEYSVSDKYNNSTTIQRVVEVFDNNKELCGEDILDNEYCENMTDEFQCNKVSALYNDTPFHCAWNNETNLCGKGLPCGTRPKAQKPPPPRPPTQEAWLQNLGQKFTSN